MHPHNGALAAARTDPAPTMGAMLKGKDVQEECTYPPVLENRRLGALFLRGETGNGEIHFLISCRFDVFAWTLLTLYKE